MEWKRERQAGTKLKIGIEKGGTDKNRTTERNRKGEDRQEYQNERRNRSKTEIQVELDEIRLYFSRRLSNLIKITM